MTVLPQSICNASEPWTAKEILTFKKLAAENMPISVICLRLGRPEPAILRKAAQVGIVLTPRNRPPYGA
jgi:hypothetical protein